MVPPNSCRAGRPVALVNANGVQARAGLRAGLFCGCGCVCVHGALRGLCEAEGAGVQVPPSAGCCALPECDRGPARGRASGCERPPVKMCVCMCIGARVRRCRCG